MPESGIPANAIGWAISIAVVICIILIIRRRSAGGRAKSEVSPETVQRNAAGSTQSYIPDTAGNEMLVAAAAAAIAEDMGTSPEHLRIHSIRRTGAAAPTGLPYAGSQALTAAMAAAIAEDMGTDPNHLRIHSIRRIGGQTGNQPIVAAITATIAEDMGTDVTHLRVHSINRI